MFSFYQYKELSITLSSILLLVGNYSAIATTTESKSLKQNPSCTSISGRIVNSSEWGSGWIDLRNIQDFQAKETIELEVGGTANQILVRLLDKDDDPNLASPSSWDMSVPANRVIKIKFVDKYSDIKQISVHGGPNPFNAYQFDENNGPATLEKVWKCE